MGLTNGSFNKLPSLGTAKMQDCLKSKKTESEDGFRCATRSLQAVIAAVVYRALDKTIPTLIPSIIVGTSLSIVVSPLLRYSNGFLCQWIKNKGSKFVAIH